MLILRLGLYVSIALAVMATWLSTTVGYPVEVAVLRGLLAFMAAGVVAYFAELIVMTAPPAEAQRAKRGASVSETEGGGLDDLDDDAVEPVDLPAIRSQREATADDSRAA